MKDNSRYINRELSWLAFNSRVLQEAQDKKVPLLERLKFLGIFSSNLDEFYRVRIANVQREINLLKESKVKVSKYGYDPSELMEEMHEVVKEQRELFDKVYEGIKQELSRSKIHIIDETQVSEGQAELVKKYFRENVLRKLVPIILSNNPGAFPLLSDNLIYLGVKLYDEREDLPTKYALIEIPTKISPRFYVLPKEGQNTYIMLLDDVIRFNLKEIFTVFDYEKVVAYGFKITRDAELDLDYDISKSFLERMSISVKDRVSGTPTRIAYDKEIDPDLLKTLRKGIGLRKKEHLMPGGRYHNFKDFMGFPKVGRKSFLYPKHRPLRHPHIPRGVLMFEAMRERDIMVHYPYQSFNYTVELLREAAIDPYVTEIRMTVYRVAEQSSLVNALVNAIKNGKRVTVMVELQARFDEEANIELANKLSSAGALVVQGVPKMKVHCKLIHIKRVRNKKKEVYGIIGTGNFHEKTANLYSDTALFTCDKHLLDEVEKTFDFFEANYKLPKYKHLIVAPFHMRKTFYELIDNEIELASKKRRAYILIKMNSLVDEGMIDKLYEASQAGVKIKMIIRGICCLKPGIPGLSDNIEAVSIIDKFLEHSRIFIFGNGGNEKFYISSADWMGRNLNRRIEIAVPIYSKDLQKELLDFFKIQLRDNSKARVLDAKQDNKYLKRGTRKFRSQTTLENFFQKMLDE